MYLILGNFFKVMNGYFLGRSLGIPTANLQGMIKNNFIILKPIFK